MDEFDVLTMLEALRGTPRPRTFLIDMVFGGRRQTVVTEEVIADFFKGKRRLAPFVSPRVGGKQVEREGRKVQKYKVPLIQPLDVITPDRLQQRAAGENIISPRTPADRLVDEQAEVLDLMDDYVTRREEWMVAQYMTTGRIHMVGEGVDEWFIPGFTQIRTLLDKFWGDADAEILGNLLTWYRLIQRNGYNAGVCVMADDVAEAYMDNAQVQKQMNMLKVDRGQIKPSELPNGASYIGSLNRPAIDIYTYSESYVDDTDGLEKSLIPDGTLIMFPAAANNPSAKILYGSYTEMDEGKTYEGTRIPRVYSDKKANTRNVELVARPLPVIRDVDCHLVAHVLEAQQN